MVSLRWSALATTCLARNLEVWLAHLKEHLENGSPFEELLDSFSTLMKAVGFIADASVEFITLWARTSALVNGQMGSMVASLVR